MNGFDSLIITKLDVLDDLDEVPVCVAYEVDGSVMTQMPASTRRMEAIKPIFERLPGWKRSTRASTGLGPARASEAVPEIFGGEDGRRNRFGLERAGAARDDDRARLEAGEVAELGRTC